MTKTTTTLSLTLLSTLLTAAGTAQAEPSQADAVRAEIVKTVGFLPGYFKAMPDSVVPGVWALTKQFESGDTALPNNVKGLIGLAVAAQIPSRTSIYGYARCARANGSSEAEVKEAVAIAALARQWSTYFNGAQLDEGKFRADLNKMKEHGALMAAGKVPAPKPMPITDARSALEDVKQYFGAVPDFIKAFPAEALPGAWTELKSVELNPATAISGKYKSLISLAVASQIPCRYCIVADTEFARMEGATDREIHEAITMAGVARHLTTLVEGLQLDEKAVRRDLDRMIPEPKRMARRDH